MRRPGARTQSGQPCEPHAPRVRPAARPPDPGWLFAGAAPRRRRPPPPAPGAAPRRHRGRHPARARAERGRGGLAARCLLRRDRLAQLRRCARSAQCFGPGRSAGRRRLKAAARLDDCPAPRARRLAGLGGRQAWGARGGRGGARRCRLCGGHRSRHTIALPQHLGQFWRQTSQSRRRTPDATRKARQAVLHANVRSITCQWIRVHGYCACARLLPAMACNPG